MASLVLSSSLALLLAGPIPNSEDPVENLRTEYFQMVIEAQQNERTPDASDIQEFLDLAEDLATDPAHRFEALQLTLTIAGRFPDEGAKTKAMIDSLDRLVEEFCHDDRLAELVLYGLGPNVPKPKYYLNWIEESTESRAVQAACRYQPVQDLMRRNRYGLTEDEKKKAIALNRDILAEFGDEPFPKRGTFGDVCRKNIFTLEKLSVGSVAPDIEGEDLDGVPFKLSDYRGKVVMLDFWGHW